MASTGDIRRRIKSVKNIQQITKAMKMVAAARLRKAQEKALASKPYTEKIIEVLTNVAQGVSEISHPLLSVRKVNKIGYLILSADKGLAGAYSSNAI
jgi:F-type H+-transporting ATPase subunit gamma